MLVLHHVVSTAGADFHQAQRLRDTVNAGVLHGTVGFHDITLRNLNLMASRKSPSGNRDESTSLPFDVTQEIDPALVEDLRRGGEPTLTQTDFEEITLVLPEKRKPKP